MSENNVYTTHSFEMLTNPLNCELSWVSFTHWDGGALGTQVDPSDPSSRVARAEVDLPQNRKLPIGGHARRGEDNAYFAVDETTVKNYCIQRLKGHGINLTVGRTYRQRLFL